MNHKIVEYWRHGYVLLSWPKSEAWACDGVVVGLVEIDELIEDLKAHRAKLAQRELGTVPEHWRV